MKILDRLSSDPRFAAAVSGVVIVAIYTLGALIASGRLHPLAVVALCLIGNGGIIAVTLFRSPEKID
jgi:hypothetical protein